MVCLKQLGRRAIHLAAQRGCTDILKSLIEQYNAPTDKHDLVSWMGNATHKRRSYSQFIKQYQDQAISLAIINGHSDSVKYLRNHYHPWHANEVSKQFSFW